MPAYDAIVSKLNSIGAHFEGETFNVMDAGFDCEAFDENCAYFEIKIEKLLYHTLPLFRLLSSHDLIDIAHTNMVYNSLVDISKDKKQMDALEQEYKAAQRFDGQYVAMNHVRGMATVEIVLREISQYYALKHWGGVGYIYLIKDINARGHEIHLTMKIGAEFAFYFNIQRIDDEIEAANVAAIAAAAMENGM